VINKALMEYKEEVSKKVFPGPSHSPYKITASELDGFLTELQKLGFDKAASAAALAAENMEPSKWQLYPKAWDILSIVLKTLENYHFFQENANS